MIDMVKRRFANEVEGVYTQKKIDEDYFCGYVCNIKIKNVSAPLIVYNGISDVCIKDEGYEWFEVYPDGANYAITIMFDNHHNLIEWYFDMTKEIGIQNGIPYEDDLYLDMIILPDGREIILDEDELHSAFCQKKITQDDVNMAYQTLKMLENKYVDNVDNLLKLTNELCNHFKD